MVLKSLKRIEELLAEYPELHIENESEDDIKISGRISIHRSIKQFVLKKAYEIEIFVPKHEDMLPYVIDKGKAINIEYPHIYENGQLCIATDVDMQLAFSSDPSLVKWMKDFVEPYFVSYEYYERYGIYPLGERSHGADGIIQSYMDIFDVDERSAKQIIYFLSYKQYRGHQPCPCGSGKRMRTCHSKLLLQFFENPTLHEQVRTDCMKIVMEAMNNEFTR